MYSRRLGSYFSAIRSRWKSYSAASKLEEIGVCRLRRDGKFAGRLTGLVGISEVTHTPVSHHRSSTCRQAEARRPLERGRLVDGSRGSFCSEIEFSEPFEWL